MSTLDPTVMGLMRCPITHSSLKAMPQEQLDAVNRRLLEGQLTDRQGRQIKQDKFEAAILNEEGSFAYSIHRGIVQLIADEAIDLNSNQTN